VQYVIIDAQGKHTLSGSATLVAGLNTISLHLHGLPAGNYVMIADLGDGKRATGRLVKQ